MEKEKMKSIIESLLFMSGEPVKITRLAKIIGLSRALIEKTLDDLSMEYKNGRGLSLLRKEDMVQLATNPENAVFVENLIKSEMQEGLSKASLEVLSIVAYRGPMTRMEIEAIRGVNCSFTLRSLLIRGLVERIENPNDSRSYWYKISFDFLKYLGISRVQDLPDFEKLSIDERINSVLGETVQQ